jgi:hypothetical protein
LFGSGCSFNGLTRQGDDEFGGNADPVVANPNFNLAAQAFCRGPERRLKATFGRVDPPVCRGAFSRECQIPFSGCASGPAKLGDSKKDTPADGLQT